MSEDSEPREVSPSKKVRNRNRNIGILEDDVYEDIFQILKSQKLNWKSPSYRKINKFGLHLLNIHNPVYGSTRDEIVTAKKKIVVKQSESLKIIERFYHDRKGSGARRIKRLIDEYFAGISERMVFNFLEREPKKQLLNPVFSNKEEIKPIHSKQVMDRHQIDLVDLTNRTCEQNGKVYKYVLSVIDVFSRFLWLVPLTEKSSNTVADVLLNIYFNYGWGSPKIIQCDQGTEFKGAVNKLCQTMGTRIIRSSPYHPESQGKSERSHKDWKGYLEFDILQDNDTNWADRLPAYARIHNESIHSAIECSPYKAMFGREAVHLSSIILAGHDIDSYSCSEEETPEAHELPSQESVEERVKNLTEIRRHIEESAKQAEERDSRGHRKKKGPISKYKIGEEVLVKQELLRKKHHKKVGAPKVLRGTILAKKKNLYQVQFADGSIQWVKVAKITSATKAEEKTRKQSLLTDDQPTSMCDQPTSKCDQPTSKCDQPTSKCDQPNILKPQRKTRSVKSFLAKDPKAQIKTKAGSFQDMKNLADRRGMDIQDNRGGGNCLFISLAHQLEMANLETLSSKDLRLRLVEHVELNEEVFRPFVPKSHYKDFKTYCKKMKRNGEWGDHLMIQAAADIFVTDIEILSTANPRPTIISPSFHRPTRQSQKLTILHLGHVAEQHYVSLLPQNQIDDHVEQNVQASSPKSAESDGDISDSSDGNGEITGTVWAQNKKFILQYLMKLSSKDPEINEERLKRHNLFIKNFPIEDRTVDFGRGYIGRKLYIKVTLDIGKNLVIQKLQDKRRLFSGRSLNLFNYPVDNDLSKITSQYQLAANEYISNVLVKEAIIFMVLCLNPQATYSEIDAFCRDTEVDLKELWRTQK